MSNKLKYKSFVKFLLVILFLAILFNIFSLTLSKVYADTPNSTNVLTDLQKDPNFKVSDYRDKSDDYSIQVIQIAESTANELLIYTFQPCQRTHYLVATCVNMSLSKNVDDTNLYNLELLSQEGVFCKYKVKDVVVADSDYRYYNISSIYRAWNEDLDGSSGNDNTINEVAFEVGKLYKASTVDGKVTYTHEFVETIEIVNPYVGFLTYSNGFYLWAESCNSHFIAFDTDKQIDFLMEADVYYTFQDFRKDTGTTNDGEKPLSKPEETKKTVTYIEKGETLDYGVFAEKFTWNRISKSEDFINDKDNNLTQNAKDNIGKTKWVLRFVETKYNFVNSGMAGCSETYTKIENVSILRLKFLTNGRLYDLGTVSNKITGDNVRDGGQSNKWDIFGWLADKSGIPVWALILIIVLIFLAILLPVLGLIFPVVGQALKVVFKAIGKLIKWLFNALVWIISLPIKGIVLIVNKCKGGGFA